MNPHEQEYDDDFLDGPELTALLKQGAKEARETHSQSGEYVNLILPSGEATRFKRVWSNYRFTDDEVAKLSAWMEIKIKTDYVDGIIGSLDFQEYNGRSFLGFAPWDAETYDSGNAPFPLRWSNHTFTPDEVAHLRSGRKLLLIVTSKNNNPYAVQVSFGLRADQEGVNRWGIIPHFEEFNRSGKLYSRMDCLFSPIFAGHTLNLEQIEAVRQGLGLPFNGLTREGRPYSCLIFLNYDPRLDCWRLNPMFM